MQFNYSSQNNVYHNDTESMAANRSISYFHVEVAAAEFTAGRSCKKNKTLVAVIYRVDLLKDTIAALQYVGGILQTASSLKLEMSAVELFGVLLCLTHTYTHIVHTHIFKCSYYLPLYI